MKQEHIGVSFHQTILMALADEGHVEKAIKTAFKFHEASSLSTHLFSYLLTQNCREMPWTLVCHKKWDDDQCIKGFQ